nr:hypothetical protein [Rhizobium leguminosarum]
MQRRLHLHASMKSSTSRAVMKSREMTPGIGALKRGLVAASA